MKRGAAKISKSRGSQSVVVGSARSARDQAAPRPKDEARPLSVIGHSRRRRSGKNVPLIERELDNTQQEQLYCWLAAGETLKVIRKRMGEKWNFWCCIETISRFWRRRASSQRAEGN